MHASRSALAALALAAVVALTACAPQPAGTPPKAANDKPIATTTAEPKDDPSQAPGQDPTQAPTPAPSSTPGIDPITDPVEPPVSTGPVPVTTWKGTPAAKLVYLDAHEIKAIKPDGTVLSDWILPDNITNLVPGLTIAFGHSPLVHPHGGDTAYGWDYVWDAFTIWDCSPLVVGPTDPPYHYYSIADNVDGVKVVTLNGIHVGSPASDALAIADETTGGAGFGFVWAAIGGFPVSVPTHGEPYIAVNIAADGPTSPITEISGPIGSWLT